MDLYCSQACEDASSKRAEDAGLVIDLSDVTPERAGELLRSAGLILAGVGKVTAS